MKKGIDYETASKIIGRHFPEVNDKLLNVLQLKHQSSTSELLMASIEQKSADLQPVPFKFAVNFKNNLKYLKYAAIPLVIILVSWVSGKINWFGESYKRVVNYQTSYEPPAPFQFYVLNEDLTAIENEEFTLRISAAGNVVPDNAQINYDGQTYFLQNLQPGQFQYNFPRLKEGVSFNLMANGITSKDYEIVVLKVPSMVNFEMVLDYPSYTRKKDETIKGSGNATVPEGTSIKWKIITESTTDVRFYAQDSAFFQKEEDAFIYDKSIFNSINYSISSSNEDLKDYEQLEFAISVVKDQYPELIVKSERDSVNQRTLYFLGQASDDYGISKLQLVYYPENHEDRVKNIDLIVSNSNFSEFSAVFPANLDLEDGVNYNLYLQLFDNDPFHGNKSVKSTVFSYRKLTKDEENEFNLNQQKETIQELNDSFDKLNDQDKRLEELSKTQKEKEQLNFNDRKNFESFFKRQKEQEQLMQNFNKQLKENIQDFENDKTNDQFKEDLLKRLEENEEQLQEDEKLLEELEKLQEKIQKEDFSQKLEELAKQNKNKKRSLEQILELTKRYFVSAKAAKIQSELEQLSKDQIDLSNKDLKENTKEKQDELNDRFDSLDEQLEELNKDNKALKKPMDLPDDPKESESIQKDQREASQNLGKDNSSGNEGEDSQQGQEQQKKAEQKQKSAGDKIKMLSEKLQQMAAAGGQEQLAEDVEMLRQILDNLVLFSFDEEGLMKQFRKINVDHNNYGKFLRSQNELREHFEHIDDSLFALSLRQPMISEQVNKQITNVFFNIDKSLSLLSENQLYQGVAAQQYVVTATNELANFLSDALDNMEQQMSSGSGQGSSSEMQLPDIIMSQEELNRQMQEGMKEGEQNEKLGEKGEKGEEGDKEGEQKGENNGDGNEGDEDGENGDGDQQNEIMSEKLFEIYQRQQELRNLLEDKLKQNEGDPQLSKLVKDMERVELELINKGFTNQTLQRMLDLKHQLLKLDNATFLQEQDDQRKSKTNDKDFELGPNLSLPDAKKYFNSIEILNRQALPLQPVYKKKVQEYFRKDNDQF
ncbi:DUF4175 family protein [Aegicerativicinus sediminis]|uniref:DUF4175 family protein n=1 Tax=Aegicerativicinus sediminis TaxID=2893202 RepID=UPI00293BA4A2|nr:DUF4175 family protein [Aegicerativicinus sediminis]